MSYFPPQGQLATIITIAVLAAAGLFATANIWTNTQTFTTTSVFKTSTLTANIANFTNSSGAIVGTITPQGIWTGYVNNPIGADYTIGVNSTGYFVEYNGKTNQILKSSADKLDASAVFQDSFNRVNTTGIQSGKGGWIDVDCGYFPLKTALQIPISGNLTFSGHGMCTLLQVSPGLDNNIFEFKGARTQASFFNVFRNFEMFGNKAGTKNTGFELNSTGFGLQDTLIDNVFLYRFGANDIQLSGVNTWNFKLVNSVIEYGNKHGLEVTGTGGGQDIRILNNKFLFNDQGISLNNTNFARIIGNFFHDNNKTAIVLNGTGSGAQNTVITSNGFDQDSFAVLNGASEISILDGRRNVISDNTFASGNAKYFIDNTNFNTFDTLETNNNMWGVPGTARINHPQTEAAGIVFANNINIGVKYSSDTGDNPVISSANDATKILKYSLASLATAHTQTATWPNANGTVAYQPTTASKTNSTAQTTASASTLFAGNAITITPTVTGNIHVHYVAQVSSGTLLDGCTLQMQEGTGTTPTAGQASSGTTVGIAKTVTSATANANTLWVLDYPITGLTKGTQAWFEIAFSNAIGGTCSLTKSETFLKEY